MLVKVDKRLLADSKVTRRTIGLQIPEDKQRRACEISVKLSEGGAGKHELQTTPPPLKNPDLL